MTGGMNKSFQPTVSSPTTQVSRPAARDTAGKPFAALGKASILNEPHGFVKVVTDAETEKVLGVHMVGPRVTELIAEATLALEMGADAEDIGLTIHPHPTLNETICFAAEMAEGTITDLYLPRKK